MRETLLPEWDALSLRVKASRMTARTRRGIPRGGAGIQASEVDAPKYAKNKAIGEATGCCAREWNVGGG